MTPYCEDTYAPSSETSDICGPKIALKGIPEPPTNKYLPRGECLQTLVAHACLHTWMQSSFTPANLETPPLKS